MSQAVLYWRACLCGIAVLNVLAWMVAAVTLRRGGRMDRLRRWQLIFSGGYVLGCAFRSFFPVFDIPRIGIVDSPFSSVLVGRSVATVAELCFAAQWALMLEEIARATQGTLAAFGARWVVPLIAAAELCSWTAVLTTVNLGHVFENSLWGMTAALLVLCVVMSWPHIERRWRPVLTAWIVAGGAYVAFMFLVDVPMYWARWVNDEAQGRHYLTLTQGLSDIASRRIVSRVWADWRHEVPWMSLYFSVAVWISISLIHAPPFKRTAQNQL